MMRDLQRPFVASSAELAELACQARRETGMTIDDAARRAQVEPGFVHAEENGEPHNNVCATYRLLKVFGIQPRALPSANAAGSVGNSVGK
ncbi:hypothetical protein [Corynebacterium cystitidis]|uniref:hypothetical protein n=1 Tax=Corynebacterium cystitidis TaxID=35757 RepID=UPI00211E2E00|nr:hypothetical protein [Corynebacterium cystitidis]